MSKYIAIIRPSMDGPLTDSLCNLDRVMEQKLANRFLPPDKQKTTPPDPNIQMWMMRARLNNAELVCFETDEQFNFESLDDFLRSMEPDDLKEFFIRHRLDVSAPRANRTRKTSLP